MVYRVPDDANWNEAWLVTEALIKQIGAEVTQHGSKFMVATITSDIQVYPDQAVRQSMMNQLDVQDLFYPDTRLAGLADREGFPFLDLALPMQVAADTNKVFFHGFGRAIGNGHCCRSHLSGEPRSPASATGTPSTLPRKSTVPMPFGPELKP